jgi:hypothetical protein
MPVFRWNSGGTECGNTTLAKPAKWIEKMFIVTIAVWLFSTCVLCGIN